MSRSAEQRVRIRIAALEQRLDCNRSTIWRWYTAEPPQFPVPHYIGERRAWWLDEIEAWEREQMARPSVGHRPEARHG